MRKLIISLASAAIALVPATGAAAQTSGQAQAESGRSQAGRERMICRRVDRSGTRMGAQRVCRTATQWSAAQEGRTGDAELDGAVGQLDVMNREANTGCIGGLGGRSEPR